MDTRRLIDFQRKLTSPQLSLSVREKKDTLFSVENPDMSLNTNFHDLWLAEHLLASTTLDSEQWILFDSRASANCCREDLEADWPLFC